MTTQLSFSKDENELLPDFRNKINKAESAEDVKKFFSQTMGLLLARIFTKDQAIEDTDISLRIGKPSGDPPFILGQRLGKTPEFIDIWEKSDLPHIVARLAQTAQNRYKHLEKNPEKTEAKIRR
ncbi:MAG: hypothetical protein EYX74_06355 [Desulfobulbaceae bacterium]|nr:MAG: hypothetical protein EYX74_06355 [Desulfobulbaceae bacterium]